MTSGELRYPAKNLFERSQVEDGGSGFRWMIYIPDFKWKSTVSSGLDFHAFDTLPLVSDRLSRLTRSFNQDDVILHESMILVFFIFETQINDPYACWDDRRHSRWLTRLNQWVGYATMWPHLRRKSLIVFKSRKAMGLPSSPHYTAYEPNTIKIDRHWATSFSSSLVTLQLTKPVLLPRYATLPWKINFSFFTGRTKFIFKSSEV